MKNRINISYLSRAFMTLFVMGAVSGCVNDDFATDGFEQTTIKDGLAVSPFVSESQEKHAYTRATTESEVNLNEKTLNTLDVFVEHVTGAKGDGTFLSQYHLPLPQGENVQEAADNFLAENWRDEGLVVGEKYNIYVAANNPLTKTTKDLKTFDVAALKGLVYNEDVDENGNKGVIINKNGTIKWNEAGTQPLGDIYKKQRIKSGDSQESATYEDSYGNIQYYRALTEEKQFMMDGVLTNWTPESGKKKQVFQPVIMNRAAAKIVLNVKFADDFINSLTKTKKTVNGVETWVDKPAAEQVFITGSPAWKFNNFAFGAPVFAPEKTPTAGVEVHNGDFSILHNQTYTGEDKHFSIVTYSYPNVWTDPTGAPSLVVSVGYTQGTGDDAVTTYNYYRIPIVPKDTKKLDRNYIYVIDAIIATRGSESHEDITEMDNLVYNVLEWNSQNNSDAIHNNVEAVQHLYLKVNPVIYTLRGDGDQTLIINYMKATGTEVGWKLFAINPSTEAKGEPVESTESNAVWGWFYDKDGKMKTTFSDWTHMGVEIEQSTEGKNNSSGTVTVTSTALYNRAIKYMLLRVYLKDNPLLYEDILIRHFPTDNIQSITGSWSSYHTTGGESTTIRQYSWNPVADGWAAGTYQSETVDVEVEATLEDYIADPTNVRRKNYDNYDMDDYIWSSDAWDYISYRTYWTAAVPQASRQAANSELNAYGPVDGYYWWGFGSENSRWYSDDYDWIQGSGNNRFYRYERFYISQYVKTEQRTRYYRDVEAPGTGNWVDWARDAGKTGTAKYDSRGDDPNCQNDLFHANIFSDGTVHYLNSTDQNNASIGNSYGNTYNNNHMYVIQISSTSDKYVLGKPLVTNNVSQDQVVAPAFMIASQIGIVSVPNYGTTWNSTTAADHCSKYMEVAVDGTRYTGWRLPTADEIEVIVNYQQGKFGNITISSEDRVIAEVLKGARYYNLSGGNTPTNISGASNGTFIRCIRELSAEEIDKLNGFDTLINKYQKKPNGN